MGKIFFGKSAEYFKYLKLSKLKEVYELLFEDNFSALFHFGNAVYVFKV